MVILSWSLISFIFFTSCPNNPTTQSHYQTLILSTTNLSTNDKNFGKTTLNSQLQAWVRGFLYGSKQWGNGPEECDVKQPKLRLCSAKAESLAEAEARLCLPQWSGAREQRYAVRWQIRIHKSRLVSTMRCWTTAVRLPSNWPARSANNWPSVGKQERQLPLDALETRSLEHPGESQPAGQKSDQQSNSRLALVQNLSNEQFNQQANILYLIVLKFLSSESPDLNTRAYWAIKVFPWFP